MYTYERSPGVFLARQDEIDRRIIQAGDVQLLVPEVLGLRKNIRRPIEDIVEFCHSIDLRGIVSAARITTALSYGLKANGLFD